jgi:hypothetical protein
MIAYMPVVNAIRSADLFSVKDGFYDLSISKQKLYGVLTNNYARHHGVAARD